MSVGSEHVLHALALPEGDGGHGRLLARDVPG